MVLVAAAVHRSPEVVIGVRQRRASVILELVDLHPTHAVWQVRDAYGRLVGEHVLAVAALDAPDLGTLWDRARSAWMSLSLSGLSAAECLNMTLPVGDFCAGSCGELPVSATVR